MTFRSRHGERRRTRSLVQLDAGPGGAGVASETRARRGCEQVQGKLRLCWPRVHSTSTLGRCADFRFLEETPSSRPHSFSSYRVSSATNGQFRKNGTLIERSDRTKRKSPAKRATFVEFIETASEAIAVSLDQQREIPHGGELALPVEDQRSREQNYLATMIFRLNR